MFPVLVNNFLQLTVFAVAIAVLAVAYYIFTKPGEVLSFVGVWINRAYEKITLGRVLPDGRVAYGDGRERYDKYQWVLKPILTCERCIAGQMALWLYLLIMPFNFLGWLYVIALSALLATFIYKKLTY